MLRVVQRVRAAVSATQPRGAASPALRRRIALLGYGLGGAFVLIVCWFAIARPFQVLPRIRPMPPFLLRDQQGQWVDAEKLRGQLLVVSFTYTRCGAACDAMNRGVVALRDRLHADGL